MRFDIRKEERKIFHHRDSEAGRSVGRESTAYPAIGIAAKSAGYASLSRPTSPWFVRGIAAGAVKG
jgi:hypothetical protein